MLLVNFRMQIFLLHFLLVFSDVPSTFCGVKHLLLASGSIKPFFKNYIPPPISKRSSIKQRFHENIYIYIPKLNIEFIMKFTFVTVYMNESFDSGTVGANKKDAYDQSEWAIIISKDTTGKVPPPPPPHTHTHCYPDNVRYTNQTGKLGRFSLLHKT